MPLKYLLGPVGDMYSLSNTFRMLVYYPSHTVHVMTLSKLYDVPLVLYSLLI